MKMEDIYIYCCLSLSLTHTLFSPNSTSFIPFYSVLFPMRSVIVVRNINGSNINKKSMLYLYYPLLNLKSY